MGEFHFAGPRAGETLRRLVTNDVLRLTDGRALYTVTCRPSGGIVDDLIVYRLAADHYVTVVNGATTEKDLVKIPSTELDGCSLWAVRLELEFPDEAWAVHAALAGCVASRFAA